MQILLACLMCLVLSVSECFALKGGPVFGGGGANVVGTYAGLLVPIPTVLPGGLPGDPTVTLTDNSLALFTLRVPQVGLATGTSAVFRNGIFYSGSILGSADPDTAKLTGVLNSAFVLITSVSSSGAVSVKAEYDANGQFVNAKIKTNRSSFSGSAARIKGQASLTFVNDNNDPNGDSGGPILYTIHGFKQSQSSG